MKSKNKSGFDHRAIGIAHNHIHGSANCFQCGGPCAITDPTQAAYTGLIRWLLESEPRYGNMPFMAESFLVEHDINVILWREQRDAPHPKENPKCQ